MKKSSRIVICITSFCVVLACLAVIFLSGGMKESSSNDNTETNNTETNNTKTSNTDNDDSNLWEKEFYNCAENLMSRIEQVDASEYVLPDLRFGYPKSKEKALRFNAKGDVLTMCVATTRRLSEGTWTVFESLFE